METVDDARMAFRFTKPHDLEARLERLAVEWDLDRASALILAALGLLTVPLARFRGGWIVPAALQALALLRFAGFGPDPIGRLLRPFGFRPRAAIEAEAGVVRSLHAQHARGDLR